MDTKQDASQIILQAILDAERSQQWVANKAGIPVTTLRRKLQGQTDFRLSEVANIACALNVNPSDLLPHSFRSEVIA
jgi:predicted transcriptional regulator